MAIRVRAPMPGDEEPLPRARGWTLAALPLAALAVAMTFRTLVEAASPSGYGYQHRRFAPWVYPTHEVVFCVAVLAIEAIALVAILAARSTAPLGGRALLLGFGMFLLLIIGAPFAMHADATIGNLLGWHFFASAWLVLFALASCVVALARRFLRGFLR